MDMEMYAVVYGEEHMECMEQVRMRGKGRVNCGKCRIGLFTIHAVDTPDDGCGW